MSAAEIQGITDALVEQQRDAEMTTARHALLFLPGEYGEPGAPLQIEVGCYTEIAGLGAQPTDVDLSGAKQLPRR